jgi:hypothetical protein
VATREACGLGAWSDRPLDSVPGLRAGDDDRHISASCLSVIAFFGPSHMIADSFSPNADPGSPAPEK